MTWRVPTHPTQEVQQGGRDGEVLLHGVVHHQDTRLWKIKHSISADILHRSVLWNIKFSVSILRILRNRCLEKKSIIPSQHHSASQEALKRQTFQLNFNDSTSQDALKRQTFQLNFNEFYITECSALKSQMLCLTFKDLTSQGVLKIQTFCPNLKYSSSMSLGALKSQTLSELAWLNTRGCSKKSIIPSQLQLFYMTGSCQN